MDYYHGTRIENIESIIKAGLKLPIFWDEDEQKRWPIVGVLGHGIYISRDYTTSLFFGNALFRVQLAEGTKILDVSPSADMKVINSLKREFGSGITADKMTLHKVLPANKQLKLNELVELTRFHFHKAWKPYQEKFKFHPQGFEQCLSMLRRYKYDGFGHPESDIGIMILSEDKVIIKELVAVITDEQRDNEDFCDSVEELRKRYFNTLDKLKLTQN